MRSNLAGSLAALLLLAHSAAAQVPGLPVRASGAGRGLHLAADLAFPNDAAGGGTTVGASAGVGLGLVGVGALVARTQAGGEGGLTAAGVTAGLRLIGGPLVPFSATLQGGAGRWTTSTIEGADVTVTSVPVSLGLALTIASPVVSLKPWLAPRVAVTRTTIDGPEGTSNRTDVGLSGGIDLGFLNGMSLRGMYDRILSDGGDLTAWSVGMGYSLRIGR